MYSEGRKEVMYKEDKMIEVYVSSSATDIYVKESGNSYGNGYKIDVKVDENKQ